MDKEIEILLNERGKDSYFSFDGRNFGRGLVNADKNADHIIQTRSFTCWRITDNNLEVSLESQGGILFNANTFLVQWNFEYFIIESNEKKVGTVFYHWKGANAGKGLSPLPPNFEDDTSIVERISQWGEPPTFFQIFPRNLIVLQGQQKDFDASASCLFMVRGELEKEIHMYEVPYAKRNLRSAAVFLAVIPNRKTIFTWWGKATPLKLKSILEGLNLDEALRSVDSSWKSFDTKTINEGREDVLFVDDDSYLHIDQVISFSPRLLYCNAITGNFLLTEVEYPLSCCGYITAFPFLQSHLYSADQPAVFLLVIQQDIWIWRGPGDVADEAFSGLVQWVESIAAEYVKRTKRSKENVVKFADAGSEPLEFKNIFPYWIKMA